MSHIPEGDARRLRELAAWYRDYAARAGAAWISETRLQTAEALAREADRREAVEGVNR